MTFDAHQLDTFVLVGSGVLLLAILAVRVSSRVGMPSLLLYLLIGVLLGESVVGIDFDDAQLAHAIGFGALAVILAEGGLTTNWREMRPSMRLGASLATLGMAVSVGDETLIVSPVSSPSFAPSTGFIFSTSSHDTSPGSTFLNSWYQVVLSSMLMVSRYSSRRRVPSSSARL